MLRLLEATTGPNALHEESGAASAFLFDPYLRVVHLLLRSPHDKNMVTFLGEASGDSATQSIPGADPDDNGRFAGSRVASERRSEVSKDFLETR